MITLNFYVIKGTITSKQIVNLVKEVIDKRILQNYRQKLTIHPDCGTQFSSKVYWKKSNNYLA